MHLATKVSVKLDYSKSGGFLFGILFLCLVDQCAGMHCIAYLLGGSNAVEVPVDEDADAIAQLLSLLHGMCCDNLSSVNVRQIYAKHGSRQCMHIYICRTEKLTDKIEEGGYW